MRTDLVAAVLRRRMTVTDGRSLMLFRNILRQRFCRTSRRLRLWSGAPCRRGEAPQIPDISQVQGLRVIDQVIRDNPASRDTK